MFCNSGNGSLSLKGCLFNVCIIAIIGFMYFFSQGRQLSYRDYPIPNQTRNLASEASQLITNFIEDWCRERSARTDWLMIIKPCFQNLKWNARKEGWGRGNRTSSIKSYVIYTDVKPEGQYSKLFIQSVTATGQKKMIGGDSWRVYINGPTSLAATVIDHVDGTYEALFLITEAGKYDVTIVLDYSLCDGLRDPPYDWFVRGTKNGRNQPDGMLGYLDDFLLSPLGQGTNKTFSPTLQIDVPNSNFNLLAHVSRNCSLENRCKLFWDGFGRWKNGKWLPFLQFPGPTGPGLYTDKSKLLCGTI